MKRSIPEAGPGARVSRSRIAAGRRCRAGVGRDGTQPGNVAQDPANWVRLARAQKPLVKRDPAVAPGAAALELSRLRAENARLKMDNAVSKKAAAYFAKESL